MDVGYFPGCSLKSTAVEYDRTVRAVCRSFGVDLLEVEDWNCCGSTPTAAISEELALSLPYRNLVKAEGQGLKSIMSPCPSCFSHLCQAQQEPGKHPDFKERMKELLGAEVEGEIALTHLVDFLYRDLGLEKIRESVTRPLTGLRVVSYYGCLTRFPGIDIEDKECPVMMDGIVEALGAEPLSWSHKTECCGASFSITKVEVVYRLVGEVLKAAKRAGADCIAVVCPLCQSNLDIRQADLQRRTSESFNLPIVYLSQLILLAQGKGFKELSFDKHLVSPKPLLEKLS